jgi:NADPH:quinone reductase-like Zn-dependent oxidoreductase|uniref:Quinone oxidoreductase PIG3 n=1 Tax=Zea mays TaxID=4577 RepID=C4J763_MAIZE|nr:unknown [Zea mays]
MPKTCCYDILLVDCRIPKFCVLLTPGSNDLVSAAAGLRGRSAASKTQIVSEVEKNVWPAVAAGKVNPVIYKTFPLSEAADAHRLIESSMHIGKILLLP